MILTFILLADDQSADDTNMPLVARLLRTISTRFIYSDITNAF